MKAFDDSNNEKLTKLRKQSVYELKAELESFEVTVAYKRRRHYKNVEILIEISQEKCFSWTEKQTLHEQSSTNKLMTSII